MLLIIFNFSKTLVTFVMSTIFYTGVKRIDDDYFIYIQEEKGPSINNARLETGAGVHKKITKYRKGRGAVVYHENLFFGKRASETCI